MPPRRIIVREIGCAALKYIVLSSCFNPQNEKKVHFLTFLTMKFFTISPFNLLHHFTLLQRFTVSPFHHLTSRFREQEDRRDRRYAGGRWPIGSGVEAASLTAV